jgi:hypothetical protein
MDRSQRVVGLLAELDGSAQRADGLRPAAGDVQGRAQRGQQGAAPVPGTVVLVTGSGGDVEDSGGVPAK